MKTKTLIRDNILLNVHIEGLKTNLENDIKSLHDKEYITQDKLNVLVIGGSSGYGHATRTALKEKANAHIVSISFEREPKGKRLGSFGYYNNQHFLEKYPDSIDINGDAFSFDIKDEVIGTYKKLNKKIDLVVYSLASGLRFDPYTNEKYVSSLKPIDEDYTGLNIDIAKETLFEQTLEKATPKEIEDTIKVMGGEDYLLWAKHLLDGDVLNKDVKFVTYTYVGPTLTHAIYKNGTIGYAKRDLEKANDKINALLKPIGGKAYISQSKAVITKASIFIPTMALYASALFKVMKENKTHETIIEHKYRLFKDFIFSEANETTIPLDAYEMDPQVQQKVVDILAQVTADNFKDLIDFDSFKKEFVAINGF